MNKLDEYFKGLEIHLKQSKHDQYQKKRVREIFERLKAGGLNLTTKNRFVEKMGRFHKQGKVQITKTPDGIDKHGANYLAIFDHKIIIGRDSSRVS